MSTIGPVMDAIGLVAGSLGIFNFAKSNLPSDPSPNGAVFKVKVGHQYEDLNYGGSIAKIEGYDTFNMLIGTASGSYISEGGVMDFTLDQKVGGIQTEYATIIGTNDAICISWITMKNLDGASDSAWTGDVAEQCGMSYHWGNDKAGTLKDTGEDHRPYCAWLDADHTNGLTTGALKIYFSAYGQKLTDTIAKQTGCSNTKFEYNAASIDGVPGKKRSNPRPSMIGASRPAWMTNRLIVSNAPGHNATELCMDEMSWGPDVVGSDGYYCNMETRELFPLCEKEEIDGCVNVDARSGKIIKRASVAKRATELHLRSYGDVRLW